MMALTIDTIFPPRDWKRDHVILINTADPGWMKVRWRGYSYGIDTIFGI